ncbi:MAG: hypothetical protein ACLVEJ_12385 [Parabacteroides sp.]
MVVLLPTIASSTTSLATNGSANLKYSRRVIQASRLPGCRTLERFLSGDWDYQTGIKRMQKILSDLGTHGPTGNRLVNSAFLLRHLVGELLTPYFLDRNTYLRSSLSATYSKDHILADQQIPDGNSVHARREHIQNRKWDILFNAYIVIS